jgi:hypothetical protein
MKILHGTWIPDEAKELIQSGGFYLWVETTAVKKTKKSKTHPYQVSGKDLAGFLGQDLGVKNSQVDTITPKYFLLPTISDRPLPSLELARYLETDIPEEFTWQYWQIDCYQTNTNVKVSGYSYEPVNNVINLLNDIHFIAINSKNEIQLGADLLFWYYYTQSFKQIILEDKYIPALKYYQPPKNKGRKKRSELEIYSGWEIICPSYEENLQNYSKSIPKLAVAGFASLPQSPQFYDESTLLRHFSECLLTDIVTHTPSTAKFSKQLSGTILEKCSDSDLITRPGKNDLALEEYQQRGVSWLHYLENLGLNGCLADDMGLGKTIEVIARLIQERNDRESVAPTLLIVPTSVIGNWQREIAKFAPHFRSIVHHGSDRSKDASEFKKEIASHHIVITSYTLVRKDAKLFNNIDWQRIVLDEAQNIKNPKAAQTKAILKLNAAHRLALTGTPVENRLLDLWSIFNFLNPGYLGKETQFRKAFEIPIQKDSDRIKALTLKKLVEPFILRRVKTDKSIIKDLPDKVEQKVYCNLTPEQASLYEAVVKDVEEQIEEKEGIERKGLILSTLMKLKQICNHPRQFLQDESEFTSNRSHKLSRLQEMIEEVQAEQESLLIFTQFREIGDALQQYFRHNYHYPTYYIHGGTSRKNRDKAIAEFQEPDTPPAVFILSLKAGGVGITLTKANHVFHFDRWWNPAVEDQASDRAFRIGQKKNVFVHKFVTLGSLEEKIDLMIEDKKRLSESVVGSDESWLTELDNDKFRELIALNRSAVLD